MRCKPARPSACPYPPRLSLTNSSVPAARKAKDRKTTRSSSRSSNKWPESIDRLFAVLALPGSHVVVDLNSRGMVERLIDDAIPLSQTHQRRQLLFGGI